MATLLANTKSFAFEAEERFDEVPSGQPRTLLDQRAPHRDPAAESVRGRRRGRHAEPIGLVRWPELLRVRPRAERIRQRPGTRLHRYRPRHAVGQVRRVLYHWPICSTAIRTPSSLRTSPIAAISASTARRACSATISCLRNPRSSGRSGSMPVSSRSFDSSRSPMCASRASRSTWPRSQSGRSRRRFPRTSFTSNRLKAPREWTPHHWSRSFLAGRE